VFGFVSSSKVKREFDLNNYTTKDEVLQAIDNLKHEPSARDANTHLAIDELILNGFSELNGARKVSDGHPRIGILLTGSQSSVPNKTVLAAARAHDADIKMVVVGVGTKVHRNELEAIASDPICQHLVVLDNVTEIDGLSYVIRHRIFQGFHLFLRDSDFLIDVILAS